MKYIHIIMPFMAILMATLVVIYRFQETTRPSTAKKILIPPFAMSTGLFMFIYPPTHIPWSWALFSFLIGGIFLAPLLIYTSKFHIVDNQIYMERSRSFIFILIGLFTVRLMLHSYIEQHISLFQTGSIFFILAFGMLFPWRVVMYLRFKKFKKDNDMIEVTNS